MKYFLIFTLLSIFIFSLASCKTKKVLEPELEYWMITLKKDLDRSYLEATYADLKIDNPRNSSKTINQYIAGFPSDEATLEKLQVRLESDENIIKFSKANSSGFKVESSTGSKAGKANPSKSH